MAEPTDEEIIREQLGRLAELAVKLNGGSSSVTTVIHKQEGMGNWTVAAVTACLMTYLALIAFLVWVVPALHDLQAYQQQHEKRLNKLETK